MVRKILAWVLWAGGVAFLGYASTQTLEGPWAVTTSVLGGLAFGAVGLVLCLRTKLSMGWLFLAFPVVNGLNLADIVEGSAVLLLAAGILAMFPDGRLPSGRRASILIRWPLSLAAALYVSHWLTPVIASNFAPFLVFIFLVTVVMVASAVRIVRDYLGAKGEMRPQLKWLAWALALGGLTLLISVIPIPAVTRLELHNLAGVILFVGSPVAIGFAVTRYRLYDIDRIISRTVSYVLVVGVLGLVVFGLIAGLAIYLPSDDPLVVAVATLVVFALFNPLRKRIQSAVDRRFNRSRYDAERVIEDFTSTLRDRVDPDGVVDGWVGVVAETMQPSAVGAWVRARP